MKIVSVKKETFATTLGTENMELGKDNILDNFDLEQEQDTGIDSTTALSQGLSIIVRRHTKHIIPFSKLKPITKACYVLYLCRMNQSEIAKLLNRTTRQIRNHIARGKQEYPTDIR